ncbi:membrane-fusion protein [Actinoalloteichus sp. GBA129-24]|uniref:Membrane-fusion protein n=2 Tax=Pseudonocardiaceae TaxID=2070 RepID=A0AAC9PQ43_9PSEU|nr:membrane-fusion protein [Actinoalloteichus fjordicus]APU18576.1 membrane-fusion protein [Actinoalloteichus sp. GBA129-24]
MNDEQNDEPRGPGESPGRADSTEVRPDEPRRDDLGSGSPPATEPSTKDRPARRSRRTRAAAEPADTRAGRRPRRRIVVGALALLLVAGGAGGVYAFDRAQAAGDDADAAPPRADVVTETIVRGDLTGSTRAQGSLEHSGGSGISAATAGTVTELPDPGQQLGLGDVAFRVDNQPILLLHGRLPAWRPFAYGMDDGPDVRQLEESLAALGHFDGEPDDTFGWPTASAIQAWQGENGLRKTGEIELGRIVFTSGDVRVGSLGVAVGDQVGPGVEVLGVTGLDKIVKIDLELRHQALAVPDKPVTVSLPGGEDVSGYVTSVGVPTETEGPTGTAVRLPVTVTLDDAEAAADLQQASVTVEFASETREDVIHVPVAALLAQPGGGFGVEVREADGTIDLITVETGMFVDGRVEISGDGLAEGQEVVVPSL